MRRSPLFLRPRLLPSTPSAAAHTLSPRAITALFGRFAGTMKRVRLLTCSSAACPSGSRRGPPIAEATADPMRSPKFRRIPFGRDGVFDHGAASVPRKTGPHILPSALSTASASASYAFRGSITHPTQSLCTLRDGRRLPPRNTRYRAPATAYPGRTSTGWNAPASWRSDSALKSSLPIAKIYPLRG